MEEFQPAFNRVHEDAQRYNKVFKITREGKNFAKELEEALKQSGNKELLKNFQTISAQFYRLTDRSYSVYIGRKNQCE